MNKITKNSLLGFFALFSIAMLGSYFGSEKSNPADAEPSAVIVQPSDLDAVRLLAPEQRAQYIKPDNFNPNPAAVSAPSPSATPGAIPMPATFSNDVRVVVVRQGETLGAIAKRVLGDSKRYEDIMRWNNITDETRIPVGMKLSIMLNEVVTAVPAAIPLKTGPATQQSYTVQSGDFLGAISQKFYGTSKKVDVILKANNLKNANSLSIGQTLIIPAE
jgi:nucleoid-associated protein YgaU|tara:strand:+ start:84 stop:737 length:654 start_codon:yes stop_codon:yes gene_type:complete